MHQPTNEQQQVYNNVMCQKEDKLDMGIEEMRMLMIKVSERRHIEVRRTINNRVQLILKICISKTNGKLQIVAMQLFNGPSEQKDKVWDRGGIQKMKTHD
jgi:hypothetical protein